ncbi:hypothetical protein [Pseudomonas sp. KNUC1026]|uniref:hypothetical protein n=1 Tax=Pseudomonas sp. KNUC1026 TaxID=2893890 RepID=UPI001F3DD47C|nr:hypothetical protein [Pseudomonas sp. KNUC1026]UFH51237.1 hypothetical protein LN139_09550 [Pseudomonas sp. KNUC1026]
MPNRRAVHLLLIAVAACAADMLLARALQASVTFCMGEAPPCGVLAWQQGALELLQLPGSHISSWFHHGALARLGATAWWWLDGLAWGLLAALVAAAFYRRTPPSA